MRMPFGNMDRSGKNSYQGGYQKGNDRFSRGSNPFDGATEMDIDTLTRRVLAEDDIGVVTSEGQVLPRNMAFENGSKNGIELVKKRVWGGERTSLDEIEADCCEDTSEYSDTTAGENGSGPENLHDFCEREDPAPFEIFYSPEALSAIAAEAASSPDVETGGALIGSWERAEDGSVTVHVERATGPGQDACRRQALLKPSMDYYRSRVGYYRQTHRWDYLGEWHKHPGAFDELSGTDLKTAHSLIRDEGWPLLLLPIVNEISGKLFMENNLILSPQLGGGVHTHVMGMSLAEAKPIQPPEVFVDDGLIEEFRQSDEKALILGGVCNPGESYVFVPMPGIRNAVLRLMKSANEEVPVSGGANVVTAVVSEESVRCFDALEGEIRELPVTMIAPSVSVYERNAGLTETTVLKNRSVALIGCGSLGSTMALSLARAGIGTFYLYDFDKLSAVNISRHQGDLADLGRYKAHVIRDKIQRINPDIRVLVGTDDIVNNPEACDSFRKAALDCDLLICTTDTDDSRMLVNSVAVEMHKPCVQAGLHERAASGIVQIYDPDSREACFACHRKLILSESAKRNEHIAYSEAEDIRGLTIQPGLAAQINLVAETAVLRAIDVLMKGHSLPALTIVYVDDPEAETGTAAAANDTDDTAASAAQTPRRLWLRMRHLELEPVPDCPVCSNAENTEEAEESASEEIEKEQPVEFSKEIDF